jgi:hypothetical protein
VKRNFYFAYAVQTDFLNINGTCFPAFLAICRYCSCHQENDNANLFTCIHFIEFINRELYCLKCLIEYQSLRNLPKGACTPAKRFRHVPKGVYTSARRFRRVPKEVCTPARWFRHVPKGVCTPAKWFRQAPTEVCTLACQSRLFDFSLCTQ